ncbi:Uncharacterised protein [Legionella wadsworthii]|uniref:Uncharacterized protein n=1 Tax=Legionella wadsworthii TaxID=28088 RepID=A0A378LRQ9_9GAMM|nr:hypothetical protein [Legionella wadsworthii]STY28538.1 Uncharacterised protein [Legionella wadsworthii]
MKGIVKSIVLSGIFVLSTYAMADNATSNPSSINNAGSTPATNNTSTTMSTPSATSTDTNTTGAQSNTTNAGMWICTTNASSPDSGSAADQADKTMAKNAANGNSAFDFALKNCRDCTKITCELQTQPAQ